MISSKELLSDRVGPDELGERTYLGVIAIYLIGGLALTALLATASYGWKNVSLPAVLILGLAVPIIGIIVSFKSDNWIVSTVGYLMVVIPFGILIGPVVALYKVPSVLQVVAITLMVTIVMMGIGLTMPPITQNWSMAIVAILALFIMGDLSRIFMPMFGVQPVALQYWDYLVAGFFVLLISYDINKAMQLPKTTDNAVDAVVGIYLDVINLFLRLLRIMGQRSDSSSSD